ncbi:hypothetical protein K2173_013537 [Erythroxylum novogranatense]|uniref:Organ specific protein n=1 Tax=Erythroxylum novogranatense TaxID=1862640 RepID=A0AAV8TJT6_9ROSI|nr:hypothetical protein K2173_013537 [Erythroxylum novogranatense]
MVYRQKLKEPTDTQYKLSSSDMKLLFSFLLLSSLLLLVNLNHARREPEDYWRNVMKDQPFPQAIKKLIAQDQTALVKDFNTRSTAIIYHSHGDQHKHK